MEFIALDLSSSVCGYSYYVGEEIKDVGYYEMNEQNMIDKAENLLSFFKKYMLDKKITTMVIESSMQAFSGGKSSGDAMFKTSQMNFFGRYIFSKIFKTEIVELNVIFARNKFFPGFSKISRAIKDKKDKELVFEIAMPELIGKGFDLPTKILKSGPRKGKEEFIGPAYDMVDSYVLAEAFIKNDFKAAEIKEVKTKKKNKL